MNQILLRTLIILIASIGLFIGCSSDSGGSDPVGNNNDPGENPGDTPEEATVEELTIADDFDFNTLQHVDVSISIPEISNSEFPSTTSGVRVFGYASSVEDTDKEVIFNGFTRNGVFTTSLDLPIHLESIGIEVRTLGMDNKVDVPIVGGEVNWTFERAVAQAGKGSFGTSGKSVVRTINEAVVHPIGSFDSNGVPDYLMDEQDVFSTGFLTELSESLPEGVPLQLTHPEYLDPQVETNVLLITEPAEVWVSFIHEGAGYRNVLGYYTYPTDTPPATANDIDTLFVVFPNTSYPLSGGNLEIGSKVYLGVFEENTSIGWFLIADGWRNGGITGGNWIVYSEDEFNSDQDRQNVLLYDQSREQLVLAFEDILIDNPFGDDDYNDAIFSIQVNPFSSVDDTDLEDIDIVEEDTDGDGVRDTVDEYPTDPDRAFNNYFPSQTTWGSLAYEDLWPNLGDYDFNDMVIAYQVNHVTNADNEIVDIFADFELRAVGASYNNGFAFEMNIPPSAISSVEGQGPLGGLYSIEGNGTETLINGQTNAVIPVFANSEDYMQPSSGYDFVNTEPGSPVVAAQQINLTINLVNTIPFEDVDSPPYNPFIVVNGDRSREIHLAGYQPTKLMNEALFGTEHDSSVLPNRTYKTSQNLPWGLLLPGTWRHVVERVDFINGYVNFGVWAESNGAVATDWYLDQPGNIEEENIWDE